MSDIFDGTEDAKTAIRAAVQYLLKESPGSDRGDIVREIIEMVKEVVRGDDALLRPIRRCTRRVVPTLGKPLVGPEPPAHVCRQSIDFASRLESLGRLG